MEVTSRQVCEDILQLMEHMKHGIFRIADAHKLTAPQVSALYCISRGQTTMGAVANKLHCDASNVTGIVDRLVGQKLVVRAESQHDRRTKILALTDRGDKVAEEVWEALIESIGCGRLTNSEKQSLHSLLLKLVQAV